MGTNQTYPPSICTHQPSKNDQFSWKTICFGSAPFVETVLDVTSSGQQKYGLPAANDMNTQIKVSTPMNDPTCLTSKMLESFRPPPETREKWPETICSFPRWKHAKFSSRLQGYLDVPNDTHVAIGHGPRTCHARITSVQCSNLTLVLTGALSTFNGLINKDQGMIWTKKI